MDVINAFKISTTTIRRQELTLQPPKELKPTKQDYQQMVYHMSELFKGILSSNQDQEQGRAHAHAGYQPIVGAVSQTQVARQPATYQSLPQQSAGPGSE